MISKTVKGSTLYAISPGEITVLLKKAHAVLGEETYRIIWQEAQRTAASRDINGSLYSWRKQLAAPGEGEERSLSR